MLVHEPVKQKNGWDFATTRGSRGSDILHLWVLLSGIYFGVDSADVWICCSLLTTSIGGDSQFLFL